MTSSAFLLGLATLFATANVWFAAARSTIPIRLDAVVLRKEVRREKHPPKDDVCLLDLGSQGVVHVDQGVFESVAEGDHITKERWSRTLQCNRQHVDLEWSADARGMVWTMPLALGVMVAVGWRSFRATCRLGNP